MGFSCCLDNSTSNFTPNFQMSFSILESAQIVEQERDDNLNIIPQDILPNRVDNFFANIGVVLDNKIPPLSQIGKNTITRSIMWNHLSGSL